MVRRRVTNNRIGYGNWMRSPETLRGLATLDNEEDIENDINPVEEVEGASAEPRDFNQLSPPQQYEDVRKNATPASQVDLFANLSRLGNLTNNVQQPAPTPVPEVTPPQQAIIPQAEQPQELPPMPAQTPEMNLPRPPAMPIETTPPPLEGIPEQKIIPRGQAITQKDIESYPAKETNSEAIDRAFTDPELLNDIREFTGLQELPAETVNQIKAHANAASKQERNLTEEEKAIRARMETGEMTTTDKILLGLAVAIPVIMGLRYGPEAFLSGAGNALTGYAKGLEIKTAQEKKDVKRLGDIDKERLKIQEKTIDINKKLLDSVPDKPSREFLKGKKGVQFGKKIGISTGDENDLLYTDFKQLPRDEKSKDEMNKTIRDTKNTLGIVNKSNMLLEDIQDIVDQLPKGTGVWEALKSSLGQPYANIPIAGKWAKPITVQVRDENGNIVDMNAFDAIKLKSTALQDAYNKATLGGTRLTGNVIDHWGGLMKDPYDLSTWYKGGIQDFKHRVQGLRDIINSSFKEEAVGNGFIREPLDRAFPSNKKEVVKGQENRKKTLENDLIEYFKEQQNGRKRT